ncbi:hypothetical protein KA977_06070 [Candidatus Dependentiae bacterium]|nr:hypothetical protein [Candidatus Dependentiae bacterium]
MKKNIIIIDCEFLKEMLKEFFEYECLYQEFSKTGLDTNNLIESIMNRTKKPQSPEFFVVHVYRDTTNIFAETKEIVGTYMDDRYLIKKFQENVVPTFEDVLDNAGEIIIVGNYDISAAQKIVRINSYFSVYKMFYNSVIICREKFNNPPKEYSQETYCVRMDCNCKFEKACNYEFDAYKPICLLL